MMPMNTTTQPGLEKLLSDFTFDNMTLEVWQNYPDVSAAEDEWTDTHACDYWAARFTQFCIDKGVPAVTVHGDDPDPDDAGYHYWTRVGEQRVDWTARQFYNLEYPRNPAHLDLPCPLVWQGEQHPIVTFDTIKEIS